MRNLKKVISSVAALAIVASSASAFAVKFPDVDASASYINAVETLQALKIVEGNEEGLFLPDKTVTRAEFTKMTVGALGEIAAAEAQTTSKFNDAANTSVHWAAGFVAQGVADGFINGYDDVTFGPDDNVTYAQAAKMLVAAIGYTTYAEAAGGWPSGYVSQASSLGITKGVSATNDTNLTRAQCAVMIYNAMQVPLCVIDSWETQTTLTGVVQTPVLKKLDGKENRDYQNLLSDKHDAYLVKGRVTANAQGSADGLEKDEVRYDVEVSDNFDDTINISKTNKNLRQNEKFKVGETKAADTLFAYTEAIVQKDDDTSEFTILSITNYGNSKTVEFKADDLADDDSTIGTYYTYYAKLPVYKSASTNSTTKYDLAVDGGAVSAEMYVNGVRVGVVDDAMIDQYILQNSTGDVTLVDKTEVGSTSTDGKYDYIMVTYYIDAVVDYVQTTSSYARVYFDPCEAKPQKMEWDPEDKDIDITFWKGDEQIAYTDLKEDDVLSIMVDIYGNDPFVNSDAFTDREYYKVLVASNTIEGNVTSRDTTEDTITVDGSEYDLVTNLVQATNFELGTQYKLFVDAFGYVAWYDEGSSEKNYGVIVASYQGNGDDYPTVRMITSDAKVVAYECKDDTEAKKFYNYAKSGNENGTDAWAGFTKSGAPFKANIKAGQTVCEYKLSGGKLKFHKAMQENGGNNLEFRANTSKLGSYTISDAMTKIIDMDEYMSDSNSGTTVKTLSISDFEDEATYTAYVYDKSTNGTEYRFAIVFEGTSSIRPETQIAVVSKVVGQVDRDSQTCQAYKVYRGAADEIDVYVEDDAAPMVEGTVISYVTNSDGNVESDNLKVLYEPDEGSYENTFANVLANNDFSDEVDYLVTTDVDSRALNKGAKAIDYGKGVSAKKVYVYFGLVYKKSGNSVEFLWRQNAGKSNIVKDDITDFSLSGANLYTYDYAGKANKGVRVTFGNSGSQGDSVLKQYSNPEKTEVTWGAAGDMVYDGATPQIVLIKEVDGDVTDAVFYVSK